MDLSRVWSVRGLRDHAVAGVAILGEASVVPVVASQRADEFLKCGVKGCSANSSQTVCAGPVKSREALDSVATILWLSGFKQLAEPVDYGQLNTRTSVPDRTAR